MKFKYQSKAWALSSDCLCLKTGYYCLQSFDCNAETGCCGAGRPVTGVNRHIACLCYPLRENDCGLPHFRRLAAALAD